MATYLSISDYEIKKKKVTYDSAYGLVADPEVTHGGGRIFKN